LADIRLACVVGARPNLMKMAPLLDALAAYPHVQAVLVHTGQHYDENLSRVFFDELGMKRPEVHLGVGSGKHGVQTARVLERLEAVLQEGTPGGKRYDRVVVVGDVNSTMAAALAAVKLKIPVAHVEAGLRSFDRSMPEEINRVVTDSVSDLLRRQRDDRHVAAPVAPGEKPRRTRSPRAEAWSVCRGDAASAGERG